MTRRFAGALATVILVLAATAGASAKTKPITGKLSKRGYTVIALAASGSAKSVVATPKFKLRPPANRVTLHLRAPDGTYAGPIVVRGAAGKGKKAKKSKQGKKKLRKGVIVGVKAGANLGKVKVKSGKGFALARGVAKKSLDTNRTATAKKGVPIGAGVVGRVKVKKLKGPNSDRDLDGIPNPLDIDDDGDLILDKFDRSGAPSARASVITDQFLFQSNLSLSLDQTANANAGGLSGQQAEAALASYGVLQMGIIPGDSAELDCGGDPNPSPPPPLLGGLSYCSSGGTGRVWVPTGPQPSPFIFPAFPDCCDSDGDGFGTMLPSNPQPAPGSGQFAMFLFHGATTSQIATGDLLIQRVTRAGVESEFPATVQYVFATVPALASFSDGQNPPVTVPYANGGPGGLGTPENPFPVAAGPSGDVALTLTFWRPQRRPIDGEEGYSDPPSAWTDIGGLNYAVAAGFTGATCPQSAFSVQQTQQNPLRPVTPQDVFPADYAGITDLAKDQPASAGNTFTYSLNLTQCLAANGLAQSFDQAGESQGFTFNGITPRGTDSANQPVWFERQ